MGHSHMCEQASIRWERIISARVTDAASPGSQPLEVIMQLPIPAGVFVRTDVDVCTPLRLVPQLMKNTCPVGPVRRLWLYPWGHNDLRQGEICSRLVMAHVKLADVKSGKPQHVD